jgi:lipoprotein-releasing system permease protein
MFHHLALFLGQRYTRPRRRQGFLSFISSVSVAGVALGVAVLITVLSVMNGFEREVRDRIMGVLAHASIASAGGFSQDWDAVAQIAKRNEAVIGVAPFIDGQAMLSRGGHVAGAQIQGVSVAQEGGVSDLPSSLTTGKFQSLDAGATVILGASLAQSLGVEVGDAIQAYAAPERGAAGPRVRRYTVTGILSTGLYAYDRSLALLSLRNAADLLGRSDGASGVRLRLRDPWLAPRVAHELARALPGPFLVSDWTRRHSTFFRALSSQKAMMFLIFALIVAVAAFNIVSTLVVVVMNKGPDIAILRTLGLRPARVMAVFMVQGTLIGLLGTGLGALGGIALASNLERLLPLIEHLLGWRFLAPDVYLLAEIPAQLEWQDVLRVTLTALVLIVAATLYPAWRAARIRPAVVLRYE